MFIYLSVEKPRDLIKRNGLNGSRVVLITSVDEIVSFSLPQAWRGDSIPNGEYNFVGVRPRRQRERVCGVADLDALFIGDCCSSNICRRLVELRNFY